VGHGGRFLAETSSVPEYYFPHTSWRQWSNTFSITLPSGVTQDENNNPGPYINAIKHHYFNVVVLDFYETVSVDAPIAAYLDSDSAYRPVQVQNLPDQAQYSVWRYVPERAR